jgi:hypothetical protein
VKQASLAMKSRDIKKPGFARGAKVGETRNLDGTISQRIEIKKVLL